MGVRCSLGAVGGLETHWSERRRVRKGRAEQSCCWPGLQHWPRSERHTRSHGSLSADPIHTRFLSIHPLSQIPASNIFKKTRSPSAECPSSVFCINHFADTSICPIRLLGNHRVESNFAWVRTKRNKIFLQLRFFLLNIFQAYIAADAVT